MTSADELYTAALTHAEQAQRELARADDAYIPRANAEASLAVALALLANIALEQTTDQTK